MDRTQPVRPSPRRIGIVCEQVLLALLTAGCTLAPTVNVPTGDLKEAAADLSSGMKGGAKEFGKGLVEGSERYREEVQEASRGVTMLAKSADELVAITRDSPAAFGDAMTKRLLQDDSVQTALKSFSGLARSGEHFAASSEKGPVLLAAKIAEVQNELTRPDGFITQQRTAIVEEFRKERRAITDTIRQERADAMKDLDAFAIKVIDDTSAQIRKIIDSALLLLILFVLVLWGLPFGAGFLVGRLTRKKP